MPRDDSLSTLFLARVLVEMESGNLRSSWLAYLQRTRKSTRAQTVLYDDSTPPLRSFTHTSKAPRARTQAEDPRTERLW
jgi:hypothetical protein